MKMIPSIIVLAIGMMLAACNTLEGVGRDIQSGGRAIERAAQ